jgi:hypothetical protein
MAVGKRGEREEIMVCVIEHRGDLGKRPAQHRRDLDELGVDVFAVRLREDRADNRGDHVLGSFRDHGEHVAHEVDSASLPARALENGPDRFLQTRVRVRHHELHPVEATDLQRAEKLGPEPLVLRSSDVESEDFPAPISGNSDGDDDGLGNDPVVDEYWLRWTPPAVRVSPTVQMRDWYRSAPLPACLSPI